MPPWNCAWMLFPKLKALSVCKWFHTAMFGFCSAAHCDRSLVDSLHHLAMTGPLWLRGEIGQINASAYMPIKPTFFWERKTTKPKSWVQFFGALFLVVSGTLLFASCQHGATQHHPAGLSMLGLVVWAFPTCPVFGMGFGWQMLLILWEKAPQECSWLGDTQESSSEQCSNERFALQCCTASDWFVNWIFAASSDCIWGYAPCNH